MVSIENIQQKLAYHGYHTKVFRNHAGEPVLKVYFPILCYLSVRFLVNKVNFTSKTRIGFEFFSLEINFLMYASGLALLLAFNVINVNSVIVVFFGLFFLYFFLCIIKLEFLKLLIMKWLEEALKSKETFK